MAEPASTAQDAERLDDALYVLHGSQGTGTIRALLYGGYLVAIFGGVYGFNLLRALLISSDPQWLRAAAASVWSLLAFGTLIIGLGLLANLDWLVPALAHRSSDRPSIGGRCCASGHGCCSSRASVSVSSSASCSAGRRWGPVSAAPRRCWAPWSEARCSAWRLRGSGWPVSTPSPRAAQGGR